MQDDFRAPHGNVRSTWNETRMLLRGPLTDRKIEAYQKAGYYSEAYRQARREKMQRKRVERVGAWIRGAEGQMIYSPR